MISAGNEAGTSSFAVAGLPLHYAWTRTAQTSADKALLCVHGITRNKHDFAFLARQLAPSFSVYAPDLLGHGDSESLDGRAMYTREVYFAQLQHALSAIRESRIGYLGTSYGGLMGMRLAAMQDSPIRCLVLNDASAALGTSFFRDAAHKIRFKPALRSMVSVEGWMRLVFRNSGSLSDEAVSELAARGSRRLADGSYELAYDPAIADIWTTRAETETDHWAPWRGVRCPVLIVRGRQSTVLTSEALEQMREVNPNFDVVEIDGVGHFPHLMSKEQIAPIERWLIEYF